MTIDTAHIARLAHLEFDDNELSRIHRDMEDILGMVGSLPDAEKRLAAEYEEKMQLRADEPDGEAFTREEMLGNAPCVYDGCIAVPKTVE